MFLLPGYIAQGKSKITNKSEVTKEVVGETESRKSVLGEENKGWGVKIG